MNGTLPAGDRGYRSGDSGRQSGSPWTVFGAVGLVCGITYTPERGTPPSGNPAAPNEQVGGESGPNRIGALRIFAFGRRDRQTQLLSHGPGQEAADRMCLPASGLHQFRKSGAVRPFQQIEDLGSLASVPRRTILFGSFGRLLPGLAFLAVLAFLAATWARVGATRAFLPGFGFSVPAAWAAPISTVVDIIWSPWAVTTAITTSITLITS